MSLILNIDTATETASVSLTSEGKELVTLFNRNLKDHASWIQPAIQEVLTLSSKSLAEVKAVAVTAGPGSYTGLRVGLATAKGLCYALGIPLITENTLKVMALAAVLSYAEPKKAENSAGMLFCPMIDARRMEVFAAVYNGRLEEIMPAAALTLTSTSFHEKLASKQIIFFGNGSGKWKEICNNRNAKFVDIAYSSKHLGILSHGKFLENEFADLAYCEPIYLKEFFTHHKK